jgi:hypothetical protein
LHLLLAQKWMPAWGQWVPVVERMVWRPALVSQVALRRELLVWQLVCLQVPDLLDQRGSNQQRSPTTLG